MLVIAIRTIGFETFLPWTTLFNVLRDMRYSNDKRRFTFRLNYTKLFALKSLLFVLLSACAQEPETISIKKSDVAEQNELPIVVGAARTNVYLPMIKTKKVGVVGNQTSVVGHSHLVDSLLSSGVNVLKVFSPEHGFRGKADAGAHVDSGKDDKTGLPIISLYGSNKKPTDDQLSGLDVILFDIQDVGARFYTYISTLHYVMEACAENDIQVIVLDRPNPNGHYVDGPVLDMDFKSFVGMHPIPIVHGMTIGEYAKMINGEGWLAGNLKCDLEVISCENYTHDKFYSLPISPSPNLRSDLSISLYPSLCLLEPTTVSVGRGTNHPFELYGHPDFPQTEFSFTPKPGPGSKSPKLKGEKCNGYYLTDSIYQRMDKLALSFLLNAFRLLKKNNNKFLLRPQSFNLIAGNDVLIKQLREGASEKEIRDSWEPALSEYKVMRKAYLIYE
jgi:uncharacterized protein YbbC (DUF1343 family)